MGTLRLLRLLACLLIGAAAVQRLYAGAAAEDAGRALSPLVAADDGLLVACAGKNLRAFQPNGSLAWTVPLGHRCNHGIAPAITEYGKVYLVADDKVIRVSPQNHDARAAAARPASEVFFSYNATPGRAEEIIGLSVSGGHSSLFVTVRNRGLFAFSLSDGLEWSFGPALDRFGYRVGCRRNASACYFDSAPVADHCEGSLYVSNNEGQLYSLYMDSRQFAWTQDLSSFDRVMTVAPGNSGRLYVVFQRKSIVLGLDVSTGNISWQQNVGPMSNQRSSLAVDSNGWISIGSLDGTLYSISPDGDVTKFLGKTAPDSVIQSGPVLDCSGFAMYVAQTIMEGKSIRRVGDHTYVSAMEPSRILFTLLAPATGTIYWTGEYPGELPNLLSSSDLNDFTVDETILLTFLSAARVGNTMQCYTRRQKEAWTCRQAKAKFVNTGAEHNDVMLLLLFQLLVIMIQAMAFRFCYIFWRKKKLQENGLQKFLEKRRSLQYKRRVLGKMISELEQKAAEDASCNETLGQLGDMVRARAGVERKLYTSYSLGRDRLGVKPHGSSILPLYHGRYKSHSFHSSQQESITVMFSESSTSEDGTSSSDSSSSSGDMELGTRSRPAEEAGPSNTANVGEGIGDECPSESDACHVFTNPLFVGGQGQSTAGSGDVLSQREELMGRTIKDSIPTKRNWLKRRTLSSTN